VKEAVIDAREQKGKHLGLRLVEVRVEDVWAYYASGAWFQYASLAEVLHSHGLCLDDVEFARLSPESEEAALRFHPGS